MSDIVVSEFMDEAALAPLRERFDVLYDSGLVDRPDDLAAALAGACALIVRNRTQVRGALLDAAPNLRAVGRLGVGLDNIDVAACRSRGIAVCPATGANTLSVAEYVITAALVLLRGAWTASAEVVSGAWPRQSLMNGREIAGRRLGLVGYGAIARAVGSRAAALGMSVAAFDPHLPATDAAWEHAERADLDAILEGSDVVSLHVPLTDETRHLIDADGIARMRPGAILINTARGGIVDETALAAALREGRLAGAALDVFETEPLDAARGRPFAGLSNMILTPHIAGLTEESNVRVSSVIARAVLAALG